MITGLTVNLICSVLLAAGILGALVAGARDETPTSPRGLFLISGLSFLSGIAAYLEAHSNPFGGGMFLPFALLIVALAFLGAALWKWLLTSPTAARWFDAISPGCPRCGSHKPPKRHCKHESCRRTTCQAPWFGPADSRCGYDNGGECARPVQLVS